MNPLTGLYSSAIGLRNSLFNRGWLHSLQLEQAVVSVGNLSTGGTGKTPFVIELGELLKQRGIRCDVLSRGYRRKTFGVLVVDPEGTPADFGDEPLLIARRLQAPVIVGERRYEAGRVAEQKFLSQIHILDDGFQHRALARDFDIVLMAPHDFEDRLLPSGRLREPLSSLERADAIVIPEGAAIDQALLRGKPVWHMRREIVLDSVPSSPLVFCGIARPEQFFAQVHSFGVTPAAEIVYRDHHAYSQSDIQHLLTMHRELNAGGFLTTEKDAINLGPLAAQLAPMSIAALKLTLDRPADLVDAILARIAERKPRS